MDRNLLTGPINVFKPTAHIKADRVLKERTDNIYSSNFSLKSNLALIRVDSKSSVIKIVRILSHDV